MNAVLIILIGACRAVIEMIGLCLLGQVVLYVLAGEGRRTNAIYRLLDLLTRGPRYLVAACLPGTCRPIVVAVISFLCLLLLWILLAVLRRFFSAGAGLN